MGRLQNEQDEFVITKTIIPSKEKPWSNYIRAVVQMLVNDGFKLSGADLVISGNVPQGAGLSSSASLEVAVAQTFKSLYAINHLSTTQMALLAQRAENEYVGCKCGIMDQLCIAVGRRNTATLINCHTLDVQHIDMPEEIEIYPLVGTSADVTAQ